MERSGAKDSERRKYDIVIQPPSAQAVIRDWAQLPHLALSVIFRQIGAVEVMTRAQWVCRPWHELSLVPLTWRVVDMSKLHQVDDVAYDTGYLVEMAREVVARSNGLMEEFYARGFGDDSLLEYIVEITDGGLKSLRLISIELGLSDGVVISLVERSPKLEYLEISLCSFSSQCMQSIIRACSKLKHFKCNPVTALEHYFTSLTCYRNETIKLFGDVEALEIANNLKELRHLQLVGCQMTNEALHAIVDRCTHLQSLGIRLCYRLIMDECLIRKCARIKTLRFPDDSLFDYDYLSAFHIPEADVEFKNYCLGLIGQNP